MNRKIEDLHSNAPFQAFLKIYQTPNFQFFRIPRNFFTWRGEGVIHSSSKTKMVFKHHNSISNLTFCVGLLILPFLINLKYGFKML